MNRRNFITVILEVIGFVLVTSYISNRCGDINFGAAFKSLTGGMHISNYKSELGQPSN